MNLTAFNDVSRVFGVISISLVKTLFSYFLRLLGGNEMWCDVCERRNAFDYQTYDELDERNLIFKELLDKKL